MRNLAEIEIEHYLDTDEELLWAATPDESRRREYGVASILGIGLFVLVPTAIASTVAYLEGQYGLQQALKILAVFCGLIAVFSALVVWSLRHSRREFYGITDKRIIVLRKGLRGGLTSVVSDNIELLWLQHVHHGLTNLYFRFPSGFFGSGTAFEAIANGLMVKDLIDQHILSNQKRHDLRAAHLISDEIQAFRPDASYLG